MIDLHCHLAYGVDDGPVENHDSVKLARALIDAGVTTVACTSHLRRDKGWVNDMSVQVPIHQNLDVALGEKDVRLHRVQGAEHYLDELLLDTCKQKQVVPFSNTNWLLVELPYHGAPPNLLGALYDLRRQGYRLLLAHIERFPYVVDREDVLESLVSAGYALQVNLGSLAGAYSKAHKKIAERLVIDGYASLLAGDCHRAEDVDDCIVKGRKVLKKLVGESGVKTLLVDNPQKILDNAPVEALAY
jgi:protein-tyrosine phosphatase